MHILIPACAVEIQIYTPMRDIEFGDQHGLALQSSAYLRRGVDGKDKAEAPGEKKKMKRKRGAGEHAGRVADRS
ncbi:hypothetical protein DUNSADRAFT_14144 [Dunaliella salina]|uniref:Encoded protein n=1 Tax=Dunaliella salina TaxID=3046 RepID=A0ABQ7H2Q3_DUNSA|nr:hypothetical protein DUNSADRAFT_14144 [Dunaliella salina]|eukprot:KAF5841141.1 hypothetical protein DUNSADRAFT_14144 [Dunaliella salina]